MTSLNEPNTISPSATALVLVQNERTAGGNFDHWEDVVGERYHFPNQYRNRMVPGRSFVYYRGVRRSGNRRGVPEYFGTGRIGRIWRDPRVPATEPKSRWRWLCDIEDYRPFLNLVPAKENGRYFEQIPFNHWSVAIRELSIEVFRRILKKADIGSVGLVADSDLAPAMPPLERVRTQLVTKDEHLFIATKVAVEKGVPGQVREAPLRRSHHAKKIGDRAERLVLDYLRRTLDEVQVNTLRWVATEGETPGWDIEYTDHAGRLVAVEVKGTQGPLFPSVDVTKNEWDAARRLRDCFWLYLVANCIGTEPTVEAIRDPASLADTGAIDATPTQWRIEFREWPSA